MKTIKFTRWYKVQDDQGAEYEEGHIEKFTDDSANHFITRGVAVEVAEEKTPKRGRPRKDSSKSDLGK